MSRSNGAGDPDALRAEIRQTRAELGETVEALAAKVDVKARIKGSAAHTKELVRGQAEQTAAAVRHSVHDAGSAAKRNPLPWAAIAAGAAAVLVVVLVIRGRRR
jgi:ElaB/YqjD/DUF883 family membrane-anchored ribosome-binding protein